jgi:hypothetical protein
VYKPIVTEPYRKESSFTFLLYQLMLPNSQAILEPVLAGCRCLSFIETAELDWTIAPCGKIVSFKLPMNRILTESFV